MRNEVTAEEYNKLIERFIDYINQKQYQSGKQLESYLEVVMENKKLKYRIEKLEEENRR